MLLSLLSKRTLYDDSRDAYGFTVRPQHAHTYREYVNIYKEEECERSQKWKLFLEQQAESTRADNCKVDNIEPLVSAVTEQSTDPYETVSGERDDLDEQLAGDTEVTAEKTEPNEDASCEEDDSSDPAQTVCGERDGSAEQLDGDSEVTAEKAVADEGLSAEGNKSTNSAETLCREREDSTEKLDAGSEVTTEKTEPDKNVSCEGDDSREKKYFPDTKESVSTKKPPQVKSLEVKTWDCISPSLSFIEHMMSVRVNKRKSMKSKNKRCMFNDIPSIDMEKLSGDESAHADQDMSHDYERIDSAKASAVESSSSDKTIPETSSPWKEELESLVRGGVPKDLRGEVWQAFVSVRTRRVESYYQGLLATECDASDGKEHDQLSSGEDKKQHKREKRNVPDKLKKQIEKVIRCMDPGLYRSIFLIRSATNISWASCIK